MLGGTVREETRHRCDFCRTVARLGGKTVVEYLGDRYSGKLCLFWWLLVLTHPDSLNSDVVWQPWIRSTNAAKEICAYLCARERLHLPYTPLSTVRQAKQL